MILLHKRFVLVVLLVPLLRLLVRELCSGYCKRAVDVTVGAVRLFSTYMTVWAPHLSALTDAELHVEAMNYVHEALQNLWAIDKELTVLVFPTICPS